MAYSARNNPADAGRQDTRTGSASPGSSRPLRSGGLSAVPTPRGNSATADDDDGDGSIVTGGTTDSQAVGKAMSDCLWCQYGKPAGVGILVGAGLAYLSGDELTRGALWGAGAGLFYGYVRG